ncbi:hypothetical protein NC652_010084 [Populus alba x Populus x berolinensis]|nr:hypothetical protein NC652_010084 [Populus alba x Populus x berolinensis]
MLVGHDLLMLGFIGICLGVLRSVSRSQINGARGDKYFTWSFQVDRSWPDGARVNRSQLVDAWVNMYLPWISWVRRSRPDGICLRFLESVGLNLSMLECVFSLEFLGGSSLPIGARVSRYLPLYLLGSVGLATKVLRSLKMGTKSWLLVVIAIIGIIPQRFNFRARKGVEVSSFGSS